MNQPSPQPDQPHHHTTAATAKRIVEIPAALRDRLDADGIPLTGATLQAARLLVAGTLAPVTRFRYGCELGNVSRWCAEHNLDLLNLTPIDIGALTVAYRDCGLDPKQMLAALTFVYRHKRDPDDSVFGLARRVDKVWTAQNRDLIRPMKQAPVLPLMCWRAMHEAIGDPDLAARNSSRKLENRARNQLIISLGLASGSRPGELGRLSASAARIDAGERLVLPLVPAGSGTVTKTGRSEIIVPLGLPPFDALPIEDDLERLKQLRREHGGDDYLIANAHFRDMRGGLSTRSITNILRRAAQLAGVENAQALTGHSLRRSMVHIGAAAGWPLHQIAAVLGHTDTTTLEDHYLEGYGGSWCRSDEGRRLLLEAARGWGHCPPNAGIAAAEAPAPAPAKKPWWHGRDLHADRRRAEQIARGSARTFRSADVNTARVARRWEAFCAEAGTDPAVADRTLLEGFAVSVTGDSPAARDRLLRHLTDYFAALPSTDINAIADIEASVGAAARLSVAITAANRRRERKAPKRREIVKVTDEMMHTMFALPLVCRFEGVRLVGLVLSQSSGAGMNWRQRQAFRFGTHTRITADAALLFAPDVSKVQTPARKPKLAMTVAAALADPLWSGYEAARTLVQHYPQASLYTQLPPDTLISRCTTLIRWLQARAAVAVAYATGLRPTDLDGIRWPDLRVDDTGAIMWKLPYSKGNLVGSRTQVLRLLPVDEPWCPVRALQRLESHLKAARAVGWPGRAAEPDSDGTVRRVFARNMSQIVVDRLMKPAGLGVRLSDFRYHEAAKVWARTQDIQMVRSALFHRRTATSAGYVDRGMTSQQRIATDPVIGIFDNLDR